ncbi:hypothetical protein G7Y79_00058g091400 [Physcia stellaris]|nr:hypothetical protein G7Y79_00058g091400 [Physcia stellaris]
MFSNNNFALYRRYKVSLPTLLVYFATFLIANAAIIRPERPAFGVHFRDPYATCVATPPVRYPGIKAFIDECIGAWRLILSDEPFSSTRWRWKRFSPEEPKPRGYASLPFKEEYRYCTITLDVLDRETDADDLAIDSVGESLRAIFDECITPQKGVAAAGFIGVGKRRRLKLAVGPTWSPDITRKPTASNGTRQGLA